MATLSETILRAQALRAEAIALREDGRRLRADFRANARRMRWYSDELKRRGQRRAETAAEIGTWPYWAPPDAELKRVLVPLAEAA